MMHYTLRLLTVVIVLAIMGCGTVPEPIVEQEAPAPEPIQAKPKAIVKAQPVVQRPTATPILSPKNSDIIFAQTSLKALGYPIGKVDGAWGKRSEAAMRLFEKNQNIESANGKLSRLNLITLQNTHEPIKTTSNTQPQPQSDSLQAQPEALNGVTGSNIANKLSSTKLNRNAPELIIDDQGYAVLVKPNPYSETITRIEAGTGVYILSQQSDWFEVETLNNQRGYIRDVILEN